MTRRVVVDASPLIILIKGDLAALLPQIFTSVIAPTGVCDEILAGKEVDRARRELPHLEWLDRVDPLKVDNAIAVYELGRGESETLSVALSLPDSIALIDDAAARNCAKTLNIPFLGTGGFLALAKRRGLIRSLADSIVAVQEAGLWISQDIVDLLLVKAGE